MKKRKKTGGREPGTPNKTTKELKERVKLLVENNMQTLVSDLKKLKPEARITAIIKLMDFVLPKQTKQEIDLKNNIHHEPTTINIQVISTPQGISFSELEVEEKLKKELEAKKQK